MNFSFMVFALSLIFDSWSTFVILPQKMLLGQFFARSSQSLVKIFILNSPMYCFSCIEQINKHKSRSLEGPKLLFGRTMAWFLQISFPSCVFFNVKKVRHVKSSNFSKIEGLFWMFGFPLGKCNLRSLCARWSIALSIVHGLATAFRAEPYRLCPLLGVEFVRRAGSLSKLKIHRNMVKSKGTILV